MTAPAVETPRRIRLQRTAGWRRPAGVISVARPTRWGNPFKLGEQLVCEPGIGRDRRWDLEPRISRPGRHDQWFAADDVVEAHVRLATRAEVVELFRLALVAPTVGMRIEGRSLKFTVEDIRRELAGHDLACWCHIGVPCHADVLLALANGWDLAPLVTA